MSGCEQGCGCSASAGEQASPSGEAAWVSHFLVPKMDCAAEERMIRLAIEQMPGVAALAFDLPQRRLRVFHAGEIQAVAGKLESLGLGARLTATEALAGAALAAERRAAEAQAGQQAGVLRLLLAINALMFLVELVGGLLAQSTGLIADSLDMFADAAVYGVALFTVGRTAQAQLRSARFAGVLQLILALAALA